ncbi:MAG: cyclic nucleotide-binding domain-containing protein [Myxococcota bacterium]
MNPREIERWFAAGECIVEPGDPGDTLFVVHSGTVRVYPTEDDAPRLVSEGGIFGETAAILGRPYAFRAEADGDVAVLAVGVTLLNRLCRENDEFPFRLIRHLAAQLGRTQATAAPAPRRAKTRSGKPGTRDAATQFVKAILDASLPGETPAPVKGKLADLASQADIPMADAYLCLQGLLDDRLVRLVDDQLAVLEIEELEELAG